MKKERRASAAALEGNSEIAQSMGSAGGCGQQPKKIAFRLTTDVRLIKPLSEMSPKEKSSVWYSVSFGIAPAQFMLA